MAVVSVLRVAHYDGCVHGIADHQGNAEQNHDETSPTPYDPVSPTPGYISEVNENINSERYTYHSAHSSTIYDSQDTEAA